MAHLLNRSWVVAIACIGAAVPAWADPLTAVVDSPSNTQIKLGQVVNLGNNLVPIDAATIPGDGKLYIGTYQASTARILVVDPATKTTSATPFLTFAGTGVNITGQGMQGLTFSPNYNDPNKPGYHKLYTYEQETGPTPSSIMFLHPEVPAPASVGVIREWTANAAGTAVDTTVSSRVVFNFGTPAGHMGGGMKFGPDGYLYLSTGDGGGNGDGNGTTSTTDGFTGRDAGGTTSDVAGISNGQDFTNVLGKVIRIDPYVQNFTNGVASARTTAPGEAAKTFGGSTAYFIPNSNPFVGNPQQIFFQSTGAAGGQVAPLAELYAIGFRNPWKLSFDKNALPGDTPFVANVGSHEREEIEKLTPGKNYGWPYREGDITAPAATGRPLVNGLLPFVNANGTPYTNASFLDLVDPTKMTGPLVRLGTRSGTGSLTFTDKPSNDLDNDGIYGPSYGDGNAVVGGFVYRGSLLPGMQGKYIFGMYQYLILDPLQPASSYAAVSSGGRLLYFDPLEAGDYPTVREFNFDLGFDITDTRSGTNNLGDLMGVVQDDSGELYAMFLNGDIKALLPSAVPEPASLMLMGVGACGLLRRRRRKV